MSSRTIRIIQLNIVVIILIVSYVTGCSNKSSAEDSNIGAKTVDNPNSIKEVEKLEIESLEEKDQTITNNVDKNIIIVNDKVNELSYSGKDYLVKSFHARFTLHNNNNKAIEFYMRLPHGAEGVDDGEAIFLFLDHGFQEVTFQMNPNETKEFIIDSKEYKVVSNIGQYEVGGIGTVGNLLIHSGDGWNSINSDKPGEITPWNPETDVDIMSKISKYENQINNLKKQNEELSNEIDNLTSLNNLLKQEGATLNSELPSYRIMKYSEMSGIREYIGKDSLRIYPSLEAPVINVPEHKRIVNCVYTVSVDGKVWGMVLRKDQMGTQVGFAPIEDLVITKESEYKFEPIESLGGFKCGDRIEKLIGTLDRDYSVIHENGHMYIFPDDNYEPVDNPMNLPFSGNKSLLTFVGDTFKVSLIRTDSPQFPLECGYKVGDKAVEVFNYFNEHYEEYNDEYYGGYCFRLSDNEIISFSINTKDLTEESLIESIGIY